MATRPMHSVRTALLCTAVVALCAAMVAPATRGQTGLAVEVESPSQLVQAFDAQARLRAESRLLASIADLESREDPFALVLDEPLQQLENLYREEGRWQDVARLQSRRLQIIRSSEGLESPRALPLLEDNLQTQIRLGEWEQVDDTFAHLRHIRSANFGPDSEAVLNTLTREAAWLQARVVLGERRRRAINFLDARELYAEALDLAEEHYGEESLALVPWLYRRAYNLALQVQILNSDSALTGELIAELGRREGLAKLNTYGRSTFFNNVNLLGNRSTPPVVVDGELIGEAYLREAIGYIDDIGDLAEASGDTELQALAMVYRGDYQILLERGSARQDFREAQELLLQAGISPERVQDFFSRPVLLPVQRFYTTFAAAEAAVAAQPVPETIPAGYTAAGSFRPWVESLASIERPGFIDEFAPAGNVEALLIGFRINSRGHVSSVEFLGHEPEDRRVRRQARRDFQAVKFRPPVIDGRPLTLDQAYLLYYPAPKE